MNVNWRVYRHDPSLDSEEQVSVLALSQIWRVALGEWLSHASLRLKYVINFRMLPRCVNICLLSHFNTIVLTREHLPRLIRTWVHSLMYSRSYVPRHISAMISSCYVRCEIARVYTIR